ncbi:DUF4062 domain-containing protein [Tundrisphaera sp. TA3]|uniref:DUF4062 domain-containing protein n=1 Tax=Tundrisphaera sp. TA3 TaxID=3435775 RepID=UPI003EC03999
MASGKPKIFISSTIYDFRDLRSAIKYWLEELDYEVFLSEFNDFPKLPDQNSYDACIQAIEMADYFILLVGGRVGGWFDQKQRISITRLEYRTAYRKLTEGRLKILTFVRQEIWDIKEDRKALSDFLQRESSQNLELDNPIIAELPNHPSKAINDPKDLFDFLREISRADEMKAAIKGESAFPAGNWVHTFANFRDIIDSLKVAFNINYSVRRITLAANLRHELLGNIKALLGKVKGVPTPQYMWTSAARSQLKGGVDDTSIYKGNSLSNLAIFCLIGAKAGDRLAVHFLNEALSSGEFLDFNPEDDKYQVGPLQETLIALRDQIDRLNSLEKLIDIQYRYRFVEKFKTFKGQTKVPIPNLELVQIFSIHDCQSNIFEILLRLFKYFGSGEDRLSTLELRPPSPFDGETLLMSKEKPSTEEVESWLSTL